jgi:hypothetical protein
MSAQLAPAAPRTIKLAADGSHLSPDAADFAGILNIRDGIVTVYASDDDLKQSSAEKACAKLAQIPGYTPWKLISDKDAELIIDRRFHNPAVDPDEYPHIVPEWHWTDTPYKPSSSGCAWVVNFHSGYVSYDYRDYHGRALAVCRPVPVSQQ